MGDLKIIGYSKSGTPYVGHNEKGHRLYLLNCYACNKEFVSSTASKKTCSEECKQEYEIFKKTKEKIKIEKIKEEDPNKPKEVSVKIPKNKLLKNKLYVEINNKINNQEEAKKAIIDFINKYNVFPLYKDIIYYLEDNSIISFEYIIKNFFNNKDEMKKVLKTNYENGEFKIIKHCRVCDSEMDTTYNNKLYCSKECRESPGKIKLQCWLCGKNFYSDSIKEKFCSLECKNKSDVEIYQIEICKLGGKIAKQCRKCGDDFITNSYNSVNCDKCREENKKYIDNLQDVVSSDYYKTQKLVYDIVTNLLPSYKIEYNQFYSFLDGLQLDVYVPNLYLAFEYDGRQHYEHVEFFHKTEEEFKAQQKRDVWKNTLCKKIV